MSKCPCCGALETARHHPGHRGLHYAPNAAPPAGAGGLLADDGTAACCLVAQQAASERGSATVEVADFVLAMTSSQEGCAALQAAGLQPGDAAAGARGTLTATFQTPAAGQAPVLSDDLLSLLERSETEARRSGAGSVTLSDIAGTLARTGGELASARFLTQRTRSHGGAGRQRRREGAGARSMRHDHGRYPERAAHRSSLAQSRPEAAASSSGDPFQLRVDAGREDAVAAAFADPVAHHGGMRSALQESDRSRERHDRVGCDTRHLERQITDLAEAHKASAREMARDRATTQARLDEMGRDITALKDLLTNAFTALDGRLGGIDAARQTRGRDETDGAERLAQIEAALQRLEASMSRQASERSSASRTSTQTSGQSRSRSRDGDGDDDRDADKDRRGGTGRSRSRSRYRLSDLSRRRRRRASRSSRFSQSSRSSRTMRGPYDNDRERTVSRDTARDMPRDNAADEVVSPDDEAQEGDPAAKRFYLSLTDDIVAAPSIGPRTASRLTPHGIKTVADLLAADAADLAERINTRYITTQTIEDWQMQARLVCTIPWLRGTHAQLLVGAGYTSADDIVAASGEDFSADILKFAATRDGQRVLRNGPPPPLEKVAKWAEFATLAELDRAA